MRYLLLFDVIDGCSVSPENLVVLSVQNKHTFLSVHAGLGYHSISRDAYRQSVVSPARPPHSISLKYQSAMLPLSLALFKYPARAAYSHLVADDKYRWVCN